MRFVDVAGPEDEETTALNTPSQEKGEALEEEKTQEPVQPVVPAEEPTSKQKVEPLPARLVGEAFGTYILLERGDELILIDKHAAHERMLYEELKANRGTVAHQMLLQPVTVTLEKNEYAAVLNALELYEQAGFELEDFGAGTILVRSAPLILGGEGVADAVMEMAGYLANSKNDLTTERLDWLYHNVACRAAVKAGDGVGRKNCSPWRTDWSKIRRFATARMDAQFRFYSKNAIWKSNSAGFDKFFTRWSYNRNDLESRKSGCTDTCGCCGGAYGIWKKWTGSGTGPSV